MPLASKIFHPSTLVLLAANAIPLLGVVFWGWDVFLLLALYWMETLIIGFWSIAAIAVTPRDAAGDDRAPRFFLVPFFVIHSGIFMSVHFMFLWSLFAGAWAAQVHDLRTFVTTIVVATGLWLPLIALFISRGFAFALRSYGPAIVPASLAYLRPEAPATSPNKPGSVLTGFYARIVSMHLSILFGGFLAEYFGTMGPLILLIALKVAADLGFHLFFDLRGDNAKPMVVTTN